MISEDIYPSSPRACRGRYARGVRHAAVTTALLVVTAAGPASAERLPAHVFTTADGLASGRVFDAVEDARGFLWFATSDGVSRFDGVRFERFGGDDGVPDYAVSAVAETPDGTIWVATPGGVASLHPTRPGRERASPRARRRPERPALPPNARCGSAAPGWGHSAGKSPARTNPLPTARKSTHRQGGEHSLGPAPTTLYPPSPRAGGRALTPPVYKTPPPNSPLPGVGPPPQKVPNPPPGLNNPSL